jgi:hypothetical protein
VATGDQFAIYPTENGSMGGVSIALDDRLADPFRNPATATRVNQLQLFSIPSYYRITDENGGARTMPLGALYKQGRWFGGVSVAVQELWGTKNRRFSGGGWPEGGLTWNAGGHTLLRERTNNNLYATGLVGTDIPNSNLSVAGSVFYAGLNALDGVDLLYPGSEYIDQFGYMADVRLGLFEESDEGPTRELVFLFNRMNMTHDVYNNRAFFEGNGSTVRDRFDRNFDRTNTVGAEYSYTHPIANGDWRIGGTITANRKMHPKIPNYELMNIPRDPGDSWAFNAGAGLVGTNESLAYGLDVIYEPIFSHTWANAAERITNDQGEVLVRAGGKTVDNEFTFSNTVLQTGLKRSGEWTEFQLGLQIHTIRYWLDQHRFVTDTQRDQYESWSEWTAGVGAGLNLSELSVRYQLRIKTGVGQPGTAVRNWPEEESGVVDFARAADFIPAPEGPLTLNGTQVLTHQLSVSVPFNQP